MANSQLKKNYNKHLIFNKNKIEWKTKFSFDVEFGSWYNFSIHINNFPKRGYLPARAWVGSLKQWVPITSKSSKFKGEAQHYVVKLPKFRGCKAPLAPVLTPTKSNQIRYAQRKWMSQVTIYFFKNFEWESGVSLGELDPIKPQQSNRSCKQSDHDCTKAQIIKQIKCY